MDTQQIIDALKEERWRLDQAIAVLGGGLQGSAVSGRRAGPAGARRGPRRMSREARARIAAAQRKRWAKLNAKRAEASSRTGKKK